MDTNFIYALTGIILVSLASLVGVFTLALKKKLLEKIVMILVSFAAGALLGGAFIHLLPESVHEGGPTFLMVTIGIVVFFIMETYIYWYHCHAGHVHTHKHKGKCPIRPMGYLNLIGDGIHNLIDGMIVASSFLVSFELGIASTIAVIFHEIPQEIGDFGVLIYSGFSRKKALFFNFLSALTAVIGVLLTYFFVSHVHGLTNYLIPFAAGGFIYIAMTDLMAELKEEENIKKATLQVILLLVGVALMYILKLAFEHAH
ncbi:ZIP family metal transporter [Candidatus Woesearchaeota archaeon]|nr:ZIP family metal transporter [Candidatus Woesearchaeota archaeon]MBW3016323.1 ZIP family metal transporter [Candidatus Woesearchaeota archaeon]